MSRIRFLQSFSFPLPINFGGIFTSPEKSHAINSFQSKAVQMICSTISLYSFTPR